jgi:hypothetical protein
VFTLGMGCWAAPTWWQPVAEATLDLLQLWLPIPRLFVDFTRHNFYQLALKRGITNWGFATISGEDTVLLGLSQLLSGTAPV